MWPRDSSLENWALKIGRHIGETKHAYVFAANHFEGSAPLTCQRLARLLDIPIQLPSPETPGLAAPEEQMKLL